MGRAGRNLSISGLYSSLEVGQFNDNRRLCRGLSAQPCGLPERLIVKSYHSGSSSARCFCCWRFILFSYIRYCLLRMLVA